MTEYPRELADLIRSQAAIAVQIADGVQNHSCPNCHDIGVVYVFQMDDGHCHHTPTGAKGSSWRIGPEGEGWYNGHLEPAPCPACKSSKLSDWLQRRCNLIGSDLEIGLSSFTRRPGKEKAHDLAGSLLSQGRNAAGFVTFFGGYGRGKSLLMKALVNGFRHQGALSLYSTLPDFLADVRAKFGESVRVTAEQTISYYRDVRVLCLDELDKVKLSDWAQETIFRLLDSRYQERREMLTVMAMNSRPEELPPEMGYLSSRMSEGQMIEIGGQDMRPVMAQIERGA